SSPDWPTPRRPGRIAAYQRRTTSSLAARSANAADTVSSPPAPAASPRGSRAARTSRRGGRRSRCRSCSKRNLVGVVAAETIAAGNGIGFRAELVSDDAVVFLAGDAADGDVLRAGDAAAAGDLDAALGRVG